MKIPEEVGRINPVDKVLGAILLREGDSKIFTEDDLINTLKNVGTNYPDLSDFLNLFNINSDTNFERDILNSGLLKFAPIGRYFYLNEEGRELIEEALCYFYGENVFESLKPVSDIVWSVYQSRNENGKTKKSCEIQKKNC